MTQTASLPSWGGCSRPPRRECGGGGAGEGIAMAESNQGLGDGFN